VSSRRVPDDGRCNMEAPLAELGPGPGPRNQHVAAFSRTEMCPPRDDSNRHTDVPEIGWACAPDTVKSTCTEMVNVSRVELFREG